MKNGIDMTETINFVLKHTEEVVKTLAKTKLVLPPYKIEITPDMLAKIHRDFVEVVPRKIIKGYDDISPNICKKITEIYELLAMIKQACEDARLMVEVEEKNKVTKKAALLI